MPDPQDMLTPVEALARHDVMLDKVIALVKRPKLTPPAVMRAATLACEIIQGRAMLAVLATLKPHEPVVDVDTMAQAEQALDDVERHGAAAAADENGVFRA